MIIPGFLVNSAESADINGVSQNLKLDKTDGIYYPSFGQQMHFKCI